tara:strand:+ start:1229 stop:1420 length:192 start_codon:yes stop_codon:yes gene_type:complete
MYKVWILAKGETKWATNSMNYHTIEEAERAAQSLFSRWMAAEEWSVHRVGTDPNQEETKQEKA